MPEITGPLAVVAIVAVVFFVARNARAWLRYWYMLSYWQRIVRVLESYRDKRCELSFPLVQELLRTVDRLDHYQEQSDAEQEAIITRAASVLTACAVYWNVTGKGARHG